MLPSSRPADKRSVVVACTVLIGSICGDIAKDGATQTGAQAMAFASLSCLQSLQSLPPTASMSDAVVIFMANVFA